MNNVFSSSDMLMKRVYHVYVYPGENFNHESLQSFASKVAVVVR